MDEKVERGSRNARAALDAYRAAHDDDRIADPDDVAAIGDLVADLFHLAHRRGITPGEMTTLADRALYHYAYESDPEHADEEV